MEDLQSFGGHWQFLTLVEGVVDNQCARVALTVRFNAYPASVQACDRLKHVTPKGIATEVPFLAIVAYSRVDTRCK